MKELSPGIKKAIMKFVRHSFGLIAVSSNGGAMAQNSITAPNNSGIITQGQTGSNYIINNAPARSISQDRAAIITNELKRIGANGRISVTAGLQSCADCDALARQLIKIIDDSNTLKVKYEPGLNLIYPYYGVGIFVRDVKNPPESAKALMQAFQTAGIKLGYIADALFSADAECQLVVFNPPPV